MNADETFVVVMQTVQESSSHKEDKHYPNKIPAKRNIIKILINGNQLTFIKSFVGEFVGSMTIYDNESNVIYMDNVKAFEGQTIYLPDSVIDIGYNITLVVNGVEYVGFLSNI